VFQLVQPFQKDCHRPHQGCMDSRLRSVLTKKITAQDFSER
jgi:hypothetical protein